MKPSRLALASALFVLLWSTGFIVGRLIVGSASPNIFLFFRFFLTALLFLAISVALRRRFPPRSQWLWHGLAGLLMNGIYLGASYWAIAQGFPAAMMALFGALQPMLTVPVAVVFLRNRVRASQLAGLALGFFGVLLVLWPSLGLTDAPHFPLVALYAAMGAILSLTIGTILQKTHMAQSDILPAIALQNFAAAACAACLVWLLGETHWQVDAKFVLALAWAVVVLSSAGAMLLLWLVRQSDVTRVSALFLLCPPFAALFAWLLFGETLHVVQMIGFAAALLGVRASQR